MFEFNSYITPLVLSAYYGMLFLLAIGTFLLTTYTWFNKRRLRNCIQTWSDPGFESIPVFPSVFLLTVMAFVGLNVLNGVQSYRWYEVIYFSMGLNWVVAYRMMTKRYITDNGIVKNINDPTQTVPWNRINDYVVREKDTYTEYTFFFTSGDLNTLRSNRIQLKVPHDKYESFRKILTYKVDRHINQVWSETSDFEQSPLFD
jgi:hypothetical protein